VRTPHRTSISGCHTTTPVVHYSRIIISLDIEFLNELCPWIYYDEDEAESDDDLGEESEGEEEEN
jgi:hypothetical protein